MPSTPKAHDRSLLPLATLFACCAGLAACIGPSTEHRKQALDEYKSLDPQFDDYAKMSLPAPSSDGFKAGMQAKEAALQALERRYIDVVHCSLTRAFRSGNDERYATKPPRSV